MIRPGISEGLGLLARGLWHRRWLSSLVFVVGSVAAAAAAIGPPYASAMQTSILRNTIAEAGPAEQGLMIIYPEERRPAFEHPDAAGLTGIPRAFADPIESAELTSPVHVDPGNSVKLTWREGSCVHLRIVRGACPAESLQVVASVATSERYGWSVGDRITLSALEGPRGPRRRGGGEPVFPLTVAGIYEPRNPDGSYWLGLPYFPDTTGMAERITGRRLYDPLFTPRATAEATRRAVSGWQPNVTLFIDRDRIEGADARPLEAAVLTARQRLAAAPRDPGQPPPTVFSSMDRALRNAVRAQQSLAVPITVVVFQLLVLSWVALFFAVTDLVHARRRELGLARLRGRGRGHAWRIAFTEPLVLLAGALPVGVLVGRAGAGAISGRLVPSSASVPIDGTTWAAAAAAVAGGLVAAGVAARSSAAAPVTELLRRSRARARGRGWVLESILLAVAAVGIVEMTRGGLSDPGGSGAAALLMPGLLSIGGALVASRILPRVAAGLARPERSQRMTTYLATRQIARDPQSGHAFVVLVAAFGLATFALWAWSVTARSHERVALAHNGAPTVFVVRLPQGMDLPDLVEAADPSRNAAAGVATFDGSTRTLAVDGERLARVAAWDPASTGDRRIVSRLRQDTAPPVMVSGRALRLDVDPSRMRTRGLRLYATIELAGSGERVDVSLRPGPGASQRIHEGRLPEGCRRACELRGILLRTGTEAIEAPVEGSLLIREVLLRSAGGWRSVDVGLSDTTRWRASTPAGELPARVLGSDLGLRLTFLTGVETMAVVATHPHALPAVTVGRVAPDPGGAQTHGLDGRRVIVRSVARVRGLPGASGPTAMIDYLLADRAAYGHSPEVEHQVWVAPGAADRIARSLRQQGATVVERRTVQRLVSRFGREGPGLALRLMLAASAAAVLLALARGVYGLHATRARRAYELAALAVLGVPRRALQRALLLEQAVISGGGALVGISVGAMGAMLAVPRMPRFAAQPPTPPISSTPDALLVAGMVSAALILVAVVTVVATRTFFRSLPLEQLRESPP